MLFSCDNRLIRLLAVPAGLAGAMLMLVLWYKPRAVSLRPDLKPMFVRVTEGYLCGETPVGRDYMHRFYVGSRSLSPMSAELFESLEDLHIYRNALEHRTFTVCERIVRGSNVVFWVGYDSKIPLLCTGACYLVNGQGKKIAMREPEARNVNDSTRHVWSAVCSEAPHSGQDYKLEVNNREILLFTAPK